MSDQVNPMLKSQIQPSWDILEQSWVVSLLNTGSKIGGHAVIVVEGIKNNRIWVGQYDIKAIAVIEKATDLVQSSIGNIPGYINRIDIFERDSYGRDYSQYSAKSWMASPEKIEIMITKIKEAKERLNNEDAPFQAAGNKRSLILGGNGGHNCVTWAEEQLTHAGIGNGTIKTDKIKAAPQIHAGCAIL